MVLYPVHTNEREAIGLFKAHSDWEGGEGGLVACIDSEIVNSQKEVRVNYIADGTADASLRKFVLVDEQMFRPETLFGSFLPHNSIPVAIGPRTDLNSGRVSFWQNSGYFLTDNFVLALDEGEGYAESAMLNPGDVMSCFSEDTLVGTKMVRRGTLTDGSVGSVCATRVMFMQMVDNVNDLFASKVSPLPVDGMFKEGPRILIYQV